MSASTNLWPYLFFIYGMTLFSGAALLTMSLRPIRTPELAEGISVALGAVLGLAVASIVLTLGAVLG